MNIYNQSFANKEWGKAHRKVMTTEISNYDEYMEMYDYFNPDPKDPEFIEAASWIFSFYEGLGVFVKQGLIDIRSIALTMTGATTALWEKYESFVYQDRVAYSSPRMLSEFEYLYRELVKYIKEHPELASSMTKPER